MLFNIKARKTSEKERQFERDAYCAKVIGDVKLGVKAQEKKTQPQLFIQETDRLADLVTADDNSAKVTKECSGKLDEIRDLIKEENPNTNKILSKFSQIKQRLIQVYDSDVSFSRWIWVLLLMNIAVLFAVSFIIGWYKLIPGQDILHNTVWVFLACGLWAGIGSVIDAYEAMYEHFSKQDFDERHLLWYYLHPFIGIALGAVVFLVLQAGLLTISGSPIQDAASANITTVTQNTTAAQISQMYNDALASGKIGATALPIALAFLAGFKQNSIINFLKNLVDVIFPPKKTNIKPEE
ncbi:MAG: hypothetical protein A2Z70_01180 [Chloroflexi bacterium RBG_13_48_17]|nr:MAG: hypothetical protein A2Z70_01180 [Chloroflexi bacterium RBG_13_48_17]